MLINHGRSRPHNANHYRESDAPAELCGAAIGRSSALGANLAAEKKLGRSRDSRSARSIAIKLDRHPLCNEVLHGVPADTLHPGCTNRNPTWRCYFESRVDNRHTATADQVANDRHHRTHTHQQRDWPSLGKQLSSVAQRFTGRECQVGAELLRAKLMSHFWLNCDCRGFAFL